MKLSILVVCLALLTTQITAQCVISSTVAAINAACTGSTCIISASLLSTLNATSCTLLSITTGANLIFAPTGSGTVSLQLGTDAGITSYSSLSITANPGVIINAAVNTGFAITNSLYISGQATLTVAANQVLSAGTSIQVQAGATLNVAGNVSASTTMTVSGTVHFSGTEVKSQAQNAWIVLKNKASSISISGSASASAYVSGNGGFDGSVSFSGNATIAAGNSPGTVFFGGDVTMTSNTQLEIDVDSSSSYDNLIIAGQFTRAGILYAHFENGYVPKNGDIFTIATHSSASGEFAIAHGNYLDATSNKVDPRYSTLNTQFVYSGATSVAISLFAVLICSLFVL